MYYGCVTTMYELVVMVTDYNTFVHGGRLGVAMNSAVKDMCNSFVYIRLS